jgi:putative membrane protein
MLDEDDLKRIETAVREAEAGTDAEIKVVIARRAADPLRLLLWPALLALAAPAAVLMMHRQASTSLMLSVQVLVFATATMALLVPILRRAIVPPAARRRMTRRLAQEQFFELGLHRTARSTGVLLLISLEEHCAELIADAGAEGALPEAVWRRALDPLLTHARSNQLGDGTVAAIGALGAILHQELPETGQVSNEISDKPAVL